MKTAIANVWLRSVPDGPAERQVLFGDDFIVERTEGDSAWGRRVKDDYPGCLPLEALGAARQASGFVAVRTTWAHAAPDIRSEPLMALHLTSRLELLDGGTEAWQAIALGDRTAFIPSRHWRRWGDFPDDPAAAARLFLGTPYLWAGNTGFGLDCSGLVQAAFLACGLACPADSHQQAAMPGARLVDGERLASGDLIFWKGHVALATGPETMIHANAHHMMVVEEPVATAIQRIASGGAGPVTSRLRPERRPLATR